MFKIRITVSISFITVFVSEFQDVNVDKYSVWVRTRFEGIYDEYSNVLIVPSTWMKDASHFAPAATPVYMMHV
jgi:hypothetical protein